MAYQDYASLVFIQGICQQINGVHVQVIGRFIEHQEIGLADDGFGQCYPGFFSSTQYLDLFIYIVSAEKETSQHGAQFHVCLLAARCLKFFKNIIIQFQVFQLVLCIETLVYIMSPVPFTFKGFPVSDDAQKG